MKEKTKEFMKKYLIGFILGILTVGIIKVSAETFFPSNQVTYDNTASGLSSSNVQGAIDELYNTCFPPTAGDQILEDQPLEKDEYECRYFFTGGNPNNYITFNGEKAGWRIISVECDGSIKIMKTANINTSNNLAWDSSSNDWALPASLNTYLNSTYYNGLNSAAKSQIVAKGWSIGKIIFDNNDLATQINDENAIKWNGKVALATVSEYIRSNSNKNNCGTFSLENDNYMDCRSTTWMYNYSEWWWTLSSNADFSYVVVRVVSPEQHMNGNIANYRVHYDNGTVRPAVYLSSEVKITGGDGTQNNPYTIE